jgi:hypothetical protein
MHAGGEYAAASTGVHMRTICYPLMATLMLAAAQAGAVDRKFDTPIGIIVIDSDASWNDLRPAPGGVNGIAFETGPGGQTMQFVLATFDGVDGKDFGASKSRELAEGMRKAEVKDGITVSPELMTFAGTQVRGFYFLRAAKATVARKGEFANMHSGVLTTVSGPLMFTISWNEGGKGAADRAFDAVKRLTITAR